MTNQEPTRIERSVDVALEGATTFFCAYACLLGFLSANSAYMAIEGVFAEREGAFESATTSAHGFVTTAMVIAMGSLAQRVKDNNAPPAVRN